jgi:hypothetical protein
MNSPSSLAWMLCEILHGCPVGRLSLTISLPFPSFVRPHASVGFSIDYSSFWVHLFLVRFGRHGAGWSHSTQAHSSLYAASLIRLHALDEPPGLRANAGFLLHLANPRLDNSRVQGS